MPTIDVVVPTVRMDSASLSAILALRAPPGAILHFYVVVDSPGVDEAGLSRLPKRGNVTVLVNERNMGAAESRNRGMNAGSGEFVLFLDDDVVPERHLLDAYLRAIAEDPQPYPGYVGVTQFPAVVNRFTAGVRTSDILTFFDLAKSRGFLAWGVTANLCLRRGAVRDVRFGRGFPKAGGGEDIDFCLRIAGCRGLAFRCVPDAVVTHPWWANGKRSYRRFFRWAFGDSLLPQLHPRLKYRNAPSLAELTVVALLLFPFILYSAQLVSYILCIVGMVLVDLSLEYARLWVRGIRVPTTVVAEAAFIRYVNDLGRVAGNLRRGRLLGLTERFDYFGTGESIEHERRIAFAKLAGWIVLLAAILVAVVF